MPREISRTLFAWAGDIACVVIGVLAIIAVFVVFGGI